MLSAKNLNRELRRTCQQVQEDEGVEEVPGTEEAGILKKSASCELRAEGAVNLGFRVSKVPSNFGGCGLAVNFLLCGVSQRSTSLNRFRVKGLGFRKWSLGASELAEFPMWSRSFLFLQG